LVIFNFEKLQSLESSEVEIEHRILHAILLFKKGLKGLEYSSFFRDVFCGHVIEFSSVTAW